MKFRRKSASESDDAALEVPSEPVSGPFDVADLPEEHERVDLGSLLVAPSEGRELRMQIDEATGAVQAVMLTGADGMLELRAFAAPRNGDLWSEMREKIGRAHV